MKKHFDGPRHIPLGWDWENLRFGIAMGHFLSPLTLLFYLSRYLEARSGLYTNELVGTVWVRTLDSSRTIGAFPLLLRGLPLTGFWLFFLWMGYQVYRNYRFHTRGTRSDYLMRRLPDRWEYHRRCWTVPVLASIAELTLMAVLIGLCWLLYRLATPVACLP